MLIIVVSHIGVMYISVDKNTKIFQLRDSQLRDVDEKRHVDYVIENCNIFVFVLILSRCYCPFSAGVVWWFFDRERMTARQR